MAGAGFKTFNTGDVLTASDVNTYLMQQTVMVFADSSARSTALGANVAEGMLSYLKSDDKVYSYNGSAWVAIDTGSTSPLTTKGDLYTYSTTDARLAVGNNGETLVVDSSTSTGLKWSPYSSVFAWTTWSPTVTGLTKGNGTEVARYAKIGKTVFFSYKFTLGSTSAITGGLIITLPSTAASTTYLCSGFHLDTGTGLYPAVPNTTTTTVEILVGLANGTYLRDTTTSSTVPFTWGTNDVFQIAGQYEEA